MTPNLDQFQLFLLALVVATSTYIGTVGRGLATRIGDRLKDGKPPGPGLRCNLISLTVADILLLTLAVTAGIRIHVWMFDKPPWSVVPKALPEQWTSVDLLPIDRFIIRVLCATIAYMLFVHLWQWGAWLKRSCTRLGPAPKLSGCNPKLIQIGSGNVMLTLSGENLKSGAGMEVIDVETKKPVEIIRTTYAPPRSVAVEIDTNKFAGPTECSVSIANPDGRSAKLDKAFKVTEPPPPPRARPEAKSSGEQE